MISRIIGTITKAIETVVDRLVPDNNLKDRLNAELTFKMLEIVPELLQAEIEAQRATLIAEIGGESWLQRNWRPLLMLVIVAIVANNYLIAPYLQLIFGVGLQLDLPSELWSLMTIGVGGYIAGRSAEKIYKLHKNRE